jgi:uncharacterized protein (DUF885 family)
MRHRQVFVGALLAAVVGGGAEAQTMRPDWTARIDAIAARSDRPDAERLAALITTWWDYTMTEFPEYATYVGYPGQDHRWTDQSLEAIARRDAEAELPERVLRTIDRRRLSADDQVNYDLFRRDVNETLEGRRFKGQYMPINQMAGMQQEVASLLMHMPARTVKGGEDVVARLSAVPTLVDQTIVLMKEGLKAGITPPRVTLRDVPQQILNQIVDDPLQSPMLKAIVDMPDSVPAADRERLRAGAVSAYTSGVVPAFRKLHRFFVDEYLPKTRETIAARDLPDGEAWYAYRVRQQTTTTLTAREIHELGLAEVKRIRGEMDRVMKETGFQGGFPEFAAFLRSDPRFFFDKSEDLLTAYRDICKRADPGLPKLFGRLPRLTYGVEPVPAYAEKSQTTAYYEGGSLATGRPGTFYANTYDLKSRPRWEMEALSLHESVPGHHLQIAIAQELESLPDFRRYGTYTAYVEGWGLYSESLGGELGFYKDPYSRFGQLTYEIWRAVRLVVDTGMHSMGWTRQQAIDFFKQSSSKPEHDIEVEIDRYIVWPGQALAYKIGQLKIRELRDYATRELGARFDVRAFHDEVLGAGALPLDVLDARVKAWVASQKAAAPAAP